MRSFHTWEVEKIVTLADKPRNSLEDDLSHDEIIAAHEHLRKNITYHLNNFLIFLPTKDPVCMYINLRLNNRPVAEVLEGKKIENQNYSPYLWLQDFKSMF